MALLVANWFDSDVLRTAQTRMVNTLSLDDMGTFGDQSALAHVLNATFAIAVAVAAWRARNLWLASAYFLVGAFVVGLPVIELNFVKSIPEPLRGFVQDRYIDTLQGLTGSVLTVGGAMVVSGVAVIVSIAVSRRRASHELSTPATSISPAS